MNLDERYWTDPLKFDPDRFNNDRRYNKDAFLPFGLGGRSCVGSYFVMTQIKAVAAFLLPKWNFTLPYSSDLDIVWHVVNRPRNSVRMHVQSRT